MHYRINCEALYPTTILARSLDEVRVLARRYAINDSDATVTLPDGEAVSLASFYVAESASAVKGLQ